jgi:phosphomannomutase/phosphoglucomutase
VVPTPLLYFATFHFSDTSSGVMVTASHNPKEFNGFKVVMQNQALSDSGVQELRERILNQRLHQGAGQETSREIIYAYIERIFSDVAIAGQIKIVVDSANAVPGIVAPRLFEELGCEVIPLFCDLDGNFPNHDPDPTVEKNLQALIAKVKETQADVGVAFDGDGDRLVVVTPRGDILWPDRLLMLFAKDVLQRNPGADILFDVKCSRLLNQVISGYGGRPIMWKTGHSPMKAKMEETKALIGGEYSGHIFIKDRWYGFDDGIYAMARLLEIITLRDQKIDAIFAAFPSQVSTPEIRVTVMEKDKFAIVDAIIEQAKFANAVVSTIDGLRVDFERGWALVRASNTSAALTFRFEAESKEILDKIQQNFKQEIRRIHPTLILNF